jgi:hypothetical protein
LSSDEIAEVVADVSASMRDLVLEVDGHPIEGLRRYAIAPTSFDYELPPPPNIVSCSKLGDHSGKVEPAYLTGIFALFAAPPVGRYTIKFGGRVTYDDEDYSTFTSTTFDVK